MVGKLSPQLQGAGRFRAVVVNAATAIRNKVHRGQKKKAVVTAHGWVKSALLRHQMSEPKDETAHSATNSMAESVHTHG